MFSLVPRFGMVFDPDGDLDYTVKVVQEAEKKGLDSILLADHYMSRWTDEKVDVWPLLAHLSAKTRKIRLGTAVTPLTLRHPSVLAKLVLAVDHVSRGRAILGAGIGWNEKEFTAYGFGWDDFKTRAEKSKEAIELILRLWTEERASYQGKYYSLNEAVSRPRPVQRPHPPVWWGGNSKNAVRLAATYGQGWIPIRITPIAYAQGVGTIKKVLPSRGGADGFIFGYTGPALLDRSLEKAQRLVPSNERSQADEAWIVGDPKRCVEIIKKYVEGGCNYIAPIFTGHERTLEQLELFSDEVMPAFP
ncbi:MAG TPA: LLM class flavin-dependent oxidoreductase [Candidatus Bathyarchaeia archaeon]|nr:LLM class flavin-dependent oxidoreductase [Candidatus Bathyarchaeia archaeon]